MNSIKIKMNKAKIKFVNEVQHCKFYYCVLDAYSRDYVKLAWMEPPVERSGDDLHITDYHKVSFKTSSGTDYIGDFNRKFLSL